LTAAAEKVLLREKMRALRRGVDPAWKASASEIAISRLQELPVFQQAQTIHTYVAWRNEVDNHNLIRRLLQEGRRVAAPKAERTNPELRHYFFTKFSELKSGAFGILEPEANPRRLAGLEQFDLVLVPGLAFGRAGNRLGFGKGHYDRFLAQVKSPKVALAFAFQVFGQIPKEPLDQQVDVIVTEQEVIWCTP
jgi:5-formyltetrahydrofolate cyclo-ligase